MLLDELIVDQGKIDILKKYIEQNEHRLKWKKEYVKLFANFYAKRCGHVTKALQLWKNIAEENYDFSTLEDLADYYSLIGKKDEFDALLSRVKDDFNTKGKLRIDLMSAECHCDYEQIFKVLKALDSEKSYEYEFFTREMYALLCKGDFETVYQRSNKMLNDITVYGDRDSCDIINYEIARKESKRNIQSEKLTDIISRDVTTPLKVAAFLLLGKQKNAETLIESDIKFNFIAANQYLTTFVFKKYLDDRIKCKLKDKLKGIH